MRRITILASALLVVLIGCSKNSGVPQVETEHLHAVPVTSTLDQAEIDDMIYFRRNGMDGGSVTASGKPAIAMHNPNGSWYVKYQDGSVENAQMTNPSKDTYRLFVRGKVVSFEQLAPR